MAIKREILGKGWKFPIRIDGRGGFTYSEGEQLIQEAIWIILGTALGERHMLPRFGCGIHELVFAPNSPGTRGAIADQVRLALTRWEPRIDVQDIDVSFGSGNTDGAIFVEITYVIKESHDTRSIVYPFFLAGEENF